MADRTGTCEQCGEAFAAGARGAVRRYCGTRCRRAAARPATRSCLWCGEDFSPPTRRRVYCNPACQVAANQARRDPAAHRERERQRRLADPEHVRGLQRAARQRNAETVNARKRADYRANPEEYKARARRWAQENPDAAKEHHRRRHANRPTGEYADILRGDVCSYCGGTAEEVDHIDPVSRGGSNLPGNYTAACKSCNSSKQANPLLVFLLNRCIDVELAAAA